MFTITALVVLGVVQSTKGDSLDRALDRDDPVRALPVAWSAPDTTVTIDESAIVIESVEASPRDEWTARPIARVRSAFWARVLRGVEAM